MISTAVAIEESLEAFLTASQRNLLFLSSDADLEAVTATQNDAIRQGAQILIKGSVREATGRVEVRVMITDAAGNARFNRLFHSEREDSSGIEGRIVMGVAQALGNPSGSTAVVNHQPKSEAYKSYLQGRSVVRREKPAEGIRAAISFYNRAVALDPNWGCAYVALAEASLQMNQVIHDTIWLDRSLDAAARSLRNDITCPSSEFRLARLLNKTGNNIPALSLFQHLSGRFSYSDQIQREIANTYLKLGLYNDAVAESIRAVTINPNQWRNRDIAAKAYLAAGNYLKAIEHFKEVTSLNADSPTGYHNLGAAYLYAGSYDLAVEPLRKALVLNPRAATHSNLGTAYFYSGRVLASVHEYEKAVALSPDSDVYIGNLATAYRLTGRRRRANDLFVKAIRLARKNLSRATNIPEWEAHIALYEAQLAQFRAAYKSIAAARNLEPHNADFLCAQIVIETLANDFDGAVASVSEYMSQGFPRALIEANPNLQALQCDRRFIKVLKKYAVSN